MSGKRGAREAARLGRLVAATLDPAEMPSDGRPELAFLGRSNAGKSSLLNALLGAQLAPVSSRPGKTLVIHFYAMPGWYLVDLPGYGYAQISKERRAAIGQEVETFLAQRQPLLGGLVVQDCRRDPEAEEALLRQWAASRNLFLAVVANKADKLTQRERVERKAALEAAWKLPVMLVSARTRENLESVRAAIRGLGLSI